MLSPLGNPAKVAQYFYLILQHFHSNSSQESERDYMASTRVGKGVALCELVISSEQSDERSRSCRPIPAQYGMVRMTSLYRK